MDNSVIPFILMWPNKIEMVYKYLQLTCQNHNAQQRTAEQQHRQLCVCTALCCVLREDR